MLMPNPSLKGVIFWQWANQSLNGALSLLALSACVGPLADEAVVRAQSPSTTQTPTRASACPRARLLVRPPQTSLSLRSRRAHAPTARRAAAYAAATVASCSIAVGLSQLVPRLRVSPSARALLSKLVPFAAVASAGCVNIGLMRWKEMRDGISVYAPSDPVTGRPSAEVLGKSSIAGTYAVGQTAASRVLTNMCVPSFSRCLCPLGCADTTTRSPSPTLILPPLLITILERRGAFRGPNGARLSTVLNLGLIGASLLVFLPPAIAAFPSRASIDPKKLEQRFRDVPYDHVEFNKGL